MNIIYRATAKKQWNPAPVHADDKWKLVKLCHESFLKAKDKEQVTYLLDQCPQEWVDYFSEYGVVVNNDGLVDYDVSGSIKRMFNYAKDLEGKILMLEDDYLWRPNTIKHLWRALDDYPLVSPYDHPSHYIEKKYYDFKFRLQITDGMVWRNSPGNTHTFGTTGDYIRGHWNLFKDGVYDTPFYESLPHQVWNPIPALATHMCVGWLSPSVDWKELYVGK